MLLAVVALLITHGLLAFYRGVRAGLVPWRPVLGVSGGLVVLFVAAASLTYPLAWSRYDVAMPEALFRASAIIGLALVTLFYGAIAVLVLGTLASCFPAARAVANPLARRPAAGATAGAALAVVGVALALRGVVAFVQSAVPKAFSDAPVGIPDSVATAVPAVSALDGPLMAVLLFLGLIGIAVHLWSGLGKTWLKAIFAVGLLVALLPVGSGASPSEVVAGFVQAVVVLGGAALLARFVLGANPAAYLLAAAWLGACSAALPLIGQPGPFYELQGWLLLVLAVALSTWWLVRGRQPG